MITIENDNILNASENIICQQVNTCGVMGSGLAKQIRDRNPEIFLKYKKYCDSHSKQEMMGKVLCYPIGLLKYVCCIFGQENFGRNKNIVYTDYGALEKGFEIVKDECIKNNWTIAIPYGIGCGLANGDWNIVFGIINKVFDDINITLYKYNKPNRM